VIELDFSLAIDRSCEVTFAVLTEIEKYLTTWAKGPIAVEKIRGDGTSGTTYTITAKVGPLKVKSPYQVGTWEPPYRFGGSRTAGPVRFEEEYTLAAEGESTALRYTARARPRGPLCIAEPLIRRQLSQLIKGDLDRLKVLVEAYAH